MKPDPGYNARGQRRQRWPAPVPAPGDDRRRDKLAFRLSPELRARIEALADEDRLPVSSWVEEVVQAEVNRRRPTRNKPTRRTVHADVAG